MIPRYSPTYTYSDSLHSLRTCDRKNAPDDLCSRLASLHKTKHVFLLASARVALYVLLKAYNRPGGVLMPAYNCIVVPEAVHYAGYSPVFCDIDYSTINATKNTIKKQISDNITVVFLTHLFGIPCDIDEIMDMSWPSEVLMVEDAAPAIGAEYRGQLVGSFGDAAIISFQSTKVIAGGTGGALLTNNDELAGKVRHALQTALVPRGRWRAFAYALARKMAMNPWVYPLTQFGYRILNDERMYEVVAPQKKVPSGFLTLCSRFSSALVLTQLDRLSWNLSRRSKLAQIYQDGLSGHPQVRLPVIPQGCSPSWIQFPILVDDKSAFYKHMKRNGIDLSWTFRYSCADSFGVDGLPNARKAAKTVLGLPTYPSLSDKQAQYICRVAREYPASAY